jgi:N-acetylmuramic acid 6-phosphate (MurNAc-6-P) etherase
MASTEQNLSEFKTIDTWPDDVILNALVGGQERAIAAVRAAIPQISKAADTLASRLRLGGRLFYAGAGTSIRIGVQDGSELPATFGMAEDKIGYLIAGGRGAMFDTLADAGTAQKAALNLLSTLAHIKLGAVYDGMMVNVQADNQKLKKRARGIVSLITGAKEDTAASALETAKGEVKPAILLCAGAASIDVARQKLFESHGNLRLALKVMAAKR